MASIFIPLVLSSSSMWFVTDLILELHNLEVLMRERATIDSLTKVSTRKMFFELSKNIYDIEQRENNKFSLIYLDIDDFKRVNDTKGHLFGDEVLRTIGKILNENKRKSDVVGRIGGEEFALLLINTTSDYAFVYCEKLRKKIEETKITYNNETLYVTVSFGIAMYDGAQDLKKLCEMADKALYKAKNSGKNRVEKSN